ncbi:GDSL-type esterase/lipase family protein [Mobilicoccus caccae]|uniref:GDSL-type esterase/lipase family protein n=1 Tax=Mobilicoccus caccae TaxID=1859295 RepID=UPI003D67DB01
MGSQTPGQHSRRAGGYPVLLSRALGLDLDYRACRGATVEDVLSTQVEAVGEETRLVTLTVGAYDVGLTDLALACVLPWRSAGAVTQIEAAGREIPLHFPARLGTLLVEIRERSPKADVVVTGYPHPTAPRRRSESAVSAHRALARLTDDLDDLLLEVARGQGALAVDVRALFDEGVGDLHAVTTPLENSFLPRASGHAAYAEAVARAVEGAGHPPAARSALRRGMAVPAVQSGPDRVGSGRLVSLGALFRRRT